VAQSGYGESLLPTLFFLEKRKVLGYPKRKTLMGNKLLGESPREFKSRPPRPAAFNLKLETDIYCPEL